jgi:quercetin dioxygenase-like cupin family protein
MSNFRFISLSEVYEPILQKILDNPEDWNAVSTYNNTAGEKNPYGFLPLVMATVPSIRVSPKNSEDQQNTPLFDKYHEVHEWLRSWNIQKTSRAAFFRLKPGDSVGRHIDEGTYYLSRDRYHFALQGEYLYNVDGEEHIIKPGTFFWFNNKLPHSAKNIGTVDRITFVFDVPYSQNNP